MENFIFFGENLHYLREKNNLTLQQIANILGFSRSQWNNYEVNTSYPKFLDLIKISKYFDIRESDLIHIDLRSSFNNINKSNNLEENYKQLLDILEERRYIIELQKEKIASLEKELQQKKSYTFPEETLPMVAEEKEPKLKK